MQCPMKNCSGTGEVGKFATHGDHNQVHAHQHFGKHHPLLGLASVAWMGVKYAFSTTYRCRKCGHIWRKW